MGERSGERSLRISRAAPGVPSRGGSHVGLYDSCCYVRPHPCRFARSSIPKQSFSHGANVINDGSPSRIRIVRRISFGITTRPRSSIRRTIPVAFMVFLLRSAAASRGFLYRYFSIIRRIWKCIQVPPLVFPGKTVPVKISSGFQNSSSINIPFLWT